MSNAGIAIEAAIKRAIEQRTREVLEEELAKAQVAVQQRMQAALANIVLSVHRMYSVEFGRNDIIIRVENKT